MQYVVLTTSPRAFSLHVILFVCVSRSSSQDGRSKDNLDALRFERFLHPTNCLGRGGLHALQDVGW